MPLMNIIHAIESKNKPFECIHKQPLIKNIKVKKIHPYRTHRMNNESLLITLYSFPLLAMLVIISVLSLTKLKRNQ